MPITDLTEYKALDDAMEDYLQRIDRAIIRSFKWCGEQAVNTARNKVSLIPNLKKYKNQTGNLVSSIGYVISVDGQLRHASSFKAVKGGHQGAREGRAFAMSLIKEFPEGIALIVVAGKEYACHLHNRGYDVVDSAEIETEMLVEELLKELKI